MKNIHVFPTSQPSSVWINYVVNRLIYGQFTSNDAKINCQNQHIYITSDEEIKEGDYFISYSFTNKNPYISCASEYKERKEDKGKIILTTDQDLIKDGVQAIPDDFLEWFVKNPSCEFVKVIDKMRIFNVDELRERHRKGLPHLYSEKIGYKIIIPKEKPKKIFNLPIATNLGSALTETMKSVSQHEGGIKHGEINLPNFKKEVCSCTDECLGYLTKTCKGIEKKPKQDLEKDTHSQSPEYDLLQHIKFCLECNNESQAIRLIEKYGHSRTLDYYDISEVKHLMTLAFEQGFKKADVVEAGLEAKETDTEVNWIFLKHKK